MSTRPLAPGLSATHSDDRTPPRVTTPDKPGGVSRGTQRLPATQVRAAAEVLARRFYYDDHAAWERADPKERRRHVERSMDLAREVLDAASRA